METVLLLHTRPSRLRMNRPSSRPDFDTFGRFLPFNPQEVERVRKHRDKCEAKRKAVAESVRLARSAKASQKPLPLI